MMSDEEFIKLAGYKIVEGTSPVRHYGRNLLLLYGPEVGFIDANADRNELIQIALLDMGVVEPRENG